MAERDPISERIDLEVFLQSPVNPDWFPVTDDDDDAPDGAVVDGYERCGNYWQKIT